MRLFRALDATQQETLLAFAAFLHERGHAQGMPTRPREPVPLPRPAEESVIAAIRRLSKTYDMLDRGAMLHETSALMSSHVLQGRAAAEIIDELEGLFERHYQEYRARHPVTG
ncbi:MAG: hypothetical protein EOM91_05700 [Sphingobacteriia bacterium]|nr:hypothetical protein [Sphingobacteriia bacterium]NCC40134.1 hypothetical protein [Gammaproteobacteria bacterium]